MKKLLLEDQKVLRETLSPFNQPTLTVKPGETVMVETYRKGYKEEKVVCPPYPNPLTGPIFVEGAEKGDTLTVEIKDIRPATDRGDTASCLWWWLGTPKLSDMTHELLNKIFNITCPISKSYLCIIKDEKVYFSDKIVLPYKPLIGTIGTAPEAEAISAYYPGIHGGNMDLPEVTFGNKLFLPVFAKGALLHLGDVHAIQGEGEINGAGVEMPAEVTLTINLIKDKTIALPRIESPDRIMSVCCSGVGKTLEDAIKIAFSDLILWMEEDYGFDRWDAYTLCGQVAEVRLGNIWTVAVKFPKEYLKRNSE